MAGTGDWSLVTGQSCPALTHLAIQGGNMSGLKGDVKGFIDLGDGYHGFMRCQGFMSLGDVRVLCNHSMSGCSWLGRCKGFISSGDARLLLRKYFIVLLIQAMSGYY